MKRIYPSIPIERETRAILSTDEAAVHLGRRPQTLRRWACYKDGPITPMRINGRLAWRVADIRALIAKPEHYVVADLAGRVVRHGYASLEEAWASIPEAQQPYFVVASAEGGK